MSEESVVKEYEVVIRVLLPGNVKVTDHPIKVKTDKGLEGALEEAKAVWYKGTETTDVRIKELSNTTKNNGVSE